MSFVIFIMEVKRTEDYLYRLGQSTHLKNVMATRPAVEDKISPATSRTLELTHSRPHNRDFLPIARHQVDYENQNIIRRIMAISDQKKTS